MKNSKDALLLRDLIKETLPLIEEGEKKALAPGGFELATSRLCGRCSNHFATTTAQGGDKIANASRPASPSLAAG